MQILVSYGVIENILQNLTVNEPKLIIHSLIALKTILEHGEDFKGNYYGDNPYATAVYACNGHRILEELQKHADDQIFKIVEIIIENFFISEPV